MDPNFQRIDRSKSDKYLFNCHKPVKYRLDSELFNKSLVRYEKFIGKSSNSRFTDESVIGHVPRNDH